MLSPVLCHCRLQYLHIYSINWIDLVMTLVADRQLSTVSQNLFFTVVKVVVDCVD